MGVMDYINRLDCYDGPEIAKIALGEPYRLYEEAFVIFSKNRNLQNLLILSAIKADKSRVMDYIESYLRAEDATDYQEVILAAKREENYEDLIRYLLMARTTAKDQLVDTELV